MMQRMDLHVHTTYSDGANTPEEMILAAIDAGLETIGFSDHSYTFFDESYCMKKEQQQAYRAEIRALGEAYRDKIRVLCGVEQDYASDASTDGFDYVIGSVHYLPCRGEYVPVDESEETLQAAVQKYFAGDFYLLAEAYYKCVADVVRKTGASIIGHFDLISKFNERTPLFDEQHPRYRTAWQKAVDTLLACDVPFEINMGAIAKGYKTVPYPNPEMRRYICEHGGRFLLSSDSHSVRTVAFGFDTL